MEVNLTARLRRTEPLKRPKAPAAGAPAPRAAASADRLSLSRQAAAFLEEQARRTREALAQQSAKQAREAAEGAGGESDELTRAMKKMKKCQEIAARIMSGGKVPPEDERYLMENDPDSYKLAMAARKIKRNPKEWESEADKEEPSVQQSGAAQAGGETVQEDAGGTGEAAAEDSGE